MPGTVADMDDGTLAAAVNVKKAATYRLWVKVDGVNVIGSPFDFLEIEPAPLDASMCMPDFFPELMYAAFDFTFKLQGRDEFGNNISLLLADAVGEEIFTAIIYDKAGRRMLQNSAPVPTIIDSEEEPGVYVVDISIPDDIRLGIYDMNLQLGTNLVVTPQVTIKSCSNEFAWSRGFLPDAGIIHLRDDVDYSISEEPIAVRLTQVPFFCNHRPIQLVADATVTYSSGSVATLDEDGLASHGIVIQQSSSDP